MISGENIGKSYGDQVLFEGLNFKINSRERVGLVGRNGHGKTTLLRLITGAETPDTGAIITPKNYRLGHVEQQIRFTQETILKEGMTGLSADESDHHWKVERILAGLGFTPGDFARHPDEFSGGYQVRLNLAKVLVAEPDLLLLDEPTNYLDITSIRWISRFLNNWPHELLLITHDRSFMDKVVTHIVGIHRCKTRKLAGITSKYYTQMAQDEEIYEKTRLNDEKRRKEIELFISRFRAKARLANMVQSRVKTLAKMEKKDKLKELKTLEFSFRSKRFAAKQVMRVEDLGFGYEIQKPLIDNLNLTIGARERICIIGKNGRGKTTLLKLLAGKLDPQKGNLSYNPNVTTGFFEQTNIQSLVDTRTIEEELLYCHPDVDRQMARNLCGAMMFSGDDALKKISVLSGGEKSRVMLAKLLATPVNLLLLDEPTNHLDMESCDAMLAAIDNFDGTVIMVTHNEMFLNALAQRLIVFQHDDVRVFEGGYPRFLEKGGWQDEETAPREDAGLRAANGERTKATKKDLRRRRSEIITAKGKALKPIERVIKQLEGRIEAKEGELGRFNRQMLTASQDQDGQRISELAPKIHRCQNDISWLYKDLETHYDRKDQMTTKYEKRLAKL